MDALLLIAHGSREQSANDEVRSLTRTLEQNLGQTFGWIDCAFLELAEPCIAKGIDACIRNGASNITVLPYFLAAGRHVTVDIPAELEKAKLANPHVQLKVTPHIGAADEVCNLLAKLSHKAL
ncbi:MAG: CbiX/SirB N-terminal domain-containing protein [Gammaproteobacteria bacterium]|nr:CbiX/SirB N-terminal domain-containing protein [Gammaproteobacteria bacterium]